MRGQWDQRMAIARSHPMALINAIGRDERIEGLRLEVRWMDE